MNMHTAFNKKPKDKIQIVKQHKNTTEITL